MDCRNYLNFNEAVPALFGFEEVWVPLKSNIFETFKVIGHAPYTDRSDAAFLDPCGAKKLLSTEEQENLPLYRLNNESQKSELIEKVLKIQNKFFITSKKDANHQLFNADIFQRSRKAVVDFVQENIKKYYIQKNEDLTRIIFGLEFEIIGDSPFERNFTPRLDAVINKRKDSYTAAELRMAYKLMKEIPDEDIQYIANQSIQFAKVVKTITNAYKRGGTTCKIEFIDPPWVGQETEWANRKRKEGRSAYEEREGNVPDWVSRLIKYKNEVKALGYT